MRTRKTIMVEKEITTYKCDLCDFSTENNTGCCGVFPIHICRYCKNDMCREHRHWYTEDDWDDHPYGFYACDNCNPKASIAWEIANETAGRHDDIIKVTDKWFKEKDLEKIYEDYI